MAEERAGIDWDAPASKIAEELAKGAGEKLLGAAGDFVLGQILTSLNLDEQAETRRKLDEIMEAINKLDADLKKLWGDLEKQLTKIDYDTVVGPLIDLASTNGKIAENLVVIARDPKSLGAQGAKGDIVDKLMTKDFLNSVGTTGTWHARLSGSGFSQTPVLKAWSMAVLAKNSPFFGLDAAEAIQRHWDYIDAQQALTVSFVIEHYNAINQPASRVKETLVEYYKNRKEQLQMLRGTKKCEDSFPTLDENTNLTTLVKTKLNCLPPRTILQFWNDKWWMWFLDLSKSITMVRDTEVQVDYKRPKEYFRRVHMSPDECTTEWWRILRESDNLSPTVNLAKEMTGLEGWDVPNPEQARALFEACGGTTGHAQDYFKTQLKSKGFSFPESSDGSYNIWTLRDPRPSYERSDQVDMQWYATMGTNIRPILKFVYRYNIFNEGQGWTCPSTDRNDHASILIRREVPSEETEKYWHT